MPIDVPALELGGDEGIGPPPLIGGFDRPGAIGGIPWMSGIERHSIGIASAIKAARVIGFC